MLEESTKIFKTLSDPNRLRILKILQTKELCVCEIQSILGLAVSTVSKHLSILKEAGFIVERKDGKWINYRINPTPGDSRISGIISALDFWIGNDEVIQQDIKKVIAVNRNITCIS